MFQVETLGAVRGSADFAFVGVLVLRYFELSLAFVPFAELKLGVSEDEVESFLLSEHSLCAVFELVVNGRHLSEDLSAVFRGTGHDSLTLRQSLFDVTLKAVETEQMTAAIDTLHPRLFHFFQTDLADT